MTTEPANETRLHRGLGLWASVGIGWGAIIGAGVFVVFAYAAGLVGSNIRYAILIAGSVALLNALSSAQLAVRFPKSGGAYEYGYEVLNPWAGFSAGWLFLTSKLSAAATVALGLGTYLSDSITGWTPQMIGVSAVLMLVVANLAGIKKVGRLNLAIVGVTLLSLLYFVVAGYPLIAPQNLVVRESQDPFVLLQASAILFFAFTGYARLATLAEEVRDPEVTIPRAIMIALVTTTILYLYIAVVAVGIVGVNNLIASDAPLVLAARMIGSPHLELVITVGAVTAMLGVLLSQILGTSRTMLAMARRSDLPGILASVKSQSQVPAMAVITSGLIIVSLVFVGRIEWLLASASFSILLYYAVVNLAAIRLKEKTWSFMQWVPELGLIGCAGLAATLPRDSILWGLAVLAVGVVFRAFRQSRRFIANPSGPSD